jgi:hypothetical protein
MLDDLAEATRAFKRILLEVLALHPYYSCGDVDWCCLETQLDHEVETFAQHREAGVAQCHSVSNTLWEHYSQEELPKTKRLAQDKLDDAFLPTGILPKTNLVQ